MRRQAITSLIGVSTLAVPIAHAPALAAQNSWLPPNHTVRACAVMTGVVRRDSVRLKVTVPNGCGRLQLVVGSPGRHPDTANVQFSESLRELPMTVVNRMARPVRADVAMRVDSIHAWRGSVEHPVRDALELWDFRDLQEPWCFAASRKLCDRWSTDWVPALAPGQSSAKIRMLFIPGALADSFRIDLQIAARLAAPDVPEPRTIATTTDVPTGRPLLESVHAPAPYAGGLLVVRFDSIPTRGALQRVADAIDGTLLGGQRVDDVPHERNYLFRVPDTATADGAVKLLARARGLPASGAGLVYPRVARRGPAGPVRIPHDTADRAGERVEMSVDFHRAPTRSERPFLEGMLARLDIAAPILTAEPLYGPSAMSMQIIIPPSTGAWKIAERLEEWLLTLPYVEFALTESTIPCPDHPARRCGTIRLDDELPPRRPEDSRLH